MAISLNKHRNIGELTYEQVDTNWDDIEGGVNGVESNQQSLNQAFVQLSEEVTEENTNFKSNMRLLFWLGI